MDEVLALKVVMIIIFAAGFLLSMFMLYTIIRDRWL
jgi:hypothetical protein